MHNTIRALLFLSVTPLVSACTGDKNKFQQAGNEPLFINVDSLNLAYGIAVMRAQRELPDFVSELETIPETSSSAVKIYISNGVQEGIFLWLINPVFNSDSCTAEVFEIPAAFTAVKVGDKLRFTKTEITDWFILNSAGGMRGGYTLRHQREQLSPQEQKDFDSYMGVKEYL